MQAAATKAARPSVSTSLHSARVATKALRRVLHLHRVVTIRFSLAETSLAMIHGSHRVKKAATNRGKMSLLHRALSLSMLARLTALQRSDLPMVMLLAMPQPMRQPVPTKALAVARPKGQVASSPRVLAQVASAAEVAQVAVQL